MSFTLTLLFLFVGVVNSQNCEYDQARMESVASENIPAAIWTPFVLSVIFIIILALPLCCGIMKETFQSGMGKGIAAFFIVLGVVFMFSPLIGSMNTCGVYVDGLCSDCNTMGDGYDCDEDAARAACGVFLTLGVYIVYCGWAVMALALTMISLACCVCCKCCKLKHEVAPIQAGVVPGTEVVVMGK